MIYKKGQKFKSTFLDTKVFYYEILDIKISANKKMYMIEGFSEDGRLTYKHNTNTLDFFDWEEVSHFPWETLISRAIQKYLRI